MTRSMRWNCERQGCFNVKKRLKLEIFDECFPGRIAMTDLDGIVEINGQALILEGKGDHVPLPVGQRLMFERLTAAGLIAGFVVEIDAETMAVTSLLEIHRGKWSAKRAATLADLKTRIRTWAGWAASQP